MLLRVHMFQPADTSTICPLCIANLAPLSESHSPYIPCCQVSPCGGVSGCGGGGGPLSLSLLFSVSPSPSFRVVFLLFFLCVTPHLSLTNYAVVAVVMKLFTCALLLSLFFPYPLFFLLAGIMLEQCCTLVTVLC